MTNRERADKRFYESFDQTIFLKHQLVTKQLHVLKEGALTAPSLDISITKHQQY
ncbi:hypothetical protein [Paenibacillus sp. TY11]|uniref:hypothetical protein n=1 Tax=Paenibacillus sp. TY11 TaxID=3448633 RepID=UPI004039C020